VTGAESPDTAALLFAVVCFVIGFVLGRVTS